VNPRVGAALVERDALAAMEDLHGARASGALRPADGQAVRDAVVVPVNLDMIVDVGLALRTTPVRSGGR